MRRANKAAQGLVGSLPADVPGRAAAIRCGRRAYILYLALVRLGAARREIGISLQGLATATGLSKTAVQRSVAHLVRRQLVSVRADGWTQAPYYQVRQPWRR
jgi:hypothetical protein